MQTVELDKWQVSVKEAKEIQNRLACRVSRINELGVPKLIAGADISIKRAEGVAEAAVITLAYPDLHLVEVKITRGKLNFPYVPGLLSFREAPLIMAAFQQLSFRPDLLLVDGQGIAHPRRFGLASHLGLLLEIPAIGCAKSRLCGRYQEPHETIGSYSDLVAEGEVIGAVLRTRTGVKPVYISTGHRIDLETAVHWTINCCRGYRIPEPTRLAHLAAGGNLKEQPGMN
ncbi:deoxyribonuclease V [Chloroflexota bacterium]